MRLACISLLTALLVFPGAAFAGDSGSVRGVIHDSQHRPVQRAMVMIKAKSSDWSASTNSDSAGNFSFNAVSLGEYAVTVVGPGFNQASQNVIVISGTQPVLHFALSVAGSKETVTVSGTPDNMPTDSATPITLVNRLDIERTPGADGTNSLAMITDYVPGAYFTHDQLHIRGGHQTSWLIDGVPVPNTNIASNLGPQFDPKDIDYLEVNRGSYGAEFGDRTYGVFNVVPRTGFERNRQAELVLGAGNFYQTNDALSFGSHTERFAYYASVNANRSNLGIQTPVPQVVHDAENGYGGFGSLIFNVDPSNQLRLVTSLRKDYYQIPYDPFPDDIENAPIAANNFAAQYPSIGFRDGDHESDAIANFSWVHTFNSKLMLTVSPFLHYNAADYASSANDFPVSTTQNRSSTYGGGQVSFGANVEKNNLQAGVYSFYQQDNELFGAIFNDGSGNPALRDVEHPSGSLAAFFVDDKFKPLSWLTLTAGMRPTHFTGGVSESAISPRFGAAVNVPRLNWTFRAFYGHYYQAPPLITASGPLVQFANANNLGFIRLNGERDEEHQFGATIPFRGWTLDADNFRTNVSNFFDHNNIGESNLFFPITIAQAVIRGWEATLRSPRIAHRGQIHLAYSNQIAEGGGVITGGLTNFSLPAGLSRLDHDQRDTLNLGGDVTLPWQAYASTNVYYGSGFSNAFVGQPYPGNYLPPHTSFDLTLGKDFSERFSASVTGLNVANRRVELDNSVTFGGFHWNNPREISVELRYRFHY
ncbi:MAG TPA: TonB-dependent receptor [Candidatus Sulfotelmatobacter sp.]|nr:TonB-dependent receptor [Candidatus Sulfotelmatobacter sp.]